MARWPFRPPVERTRQGYRVHLDEREREVVAGLLEQFRDLLVGPADHPALRRVFPTAYHRPEHAEHDAEYQRLMREELVASRLAGIEIVMDVLRSNARTTLDEGQVLALMQALNGLRLVLGTVLDVGEDDDPDDIGPDHPMATEHQLYAFFSWLLEWTVRALSVDLAD
jgi:hypothetical protein